MATSFHAFNDRENLSNPVLKNNVSKGAQGQRRLSTKTFHQPTPRKALGDLGNIQHGPSQKFQTPKPSGSKVKIYQETPRTNQTKSVKPKKGAFSVLNTNKVTSRAGEAKLKTSSTNNFPEVEKMVPFFDQENDLPTPQCIKQLLHHPRILNPGAIFPPRKSTTDDNKRFSELEFETVRQPCYDDTLADIVGYDTIEFCEVDNDFLPSLDDIPLDLPLLQ